MSAHEKATHKLPDYVPAPFCPDCERRFECNYEREALLAEVGEALKEAEDALEHLWAAIGDRLCAEGPLELAYGQAVSSRVRKASIRIAAAAAKLERAK